MYLSMPPRTIQMSFVSKFGMVSYRQGDNCEIYDGGNEIMDVLKLLIICIYSKYICIMNEM